MPSQYAWGNAELIDYKNSHGDRLQGALYYPANYEKGKQYPMIVQIYEIESNQLHNWTAPSERATYNADGWTQNGYFVLRPDIIFRPRDPGLSALDCVTSAVKKVLERRHGRRQTSRAGGPFVGRIRDYVHPDADRHVRGGRGGRPADQSGVELWRDLLEQRRSGDQSRGSGAGAHGSPAVRRSAGVHSQFGGFFANKLAAPLLLSVGDHDGASDWHQDIEFYNSARRAGKPVVMLVYEGENHCGGAEGQSARLSSPDQCLVRSLLEGRAGRGLDHEGVSVLKREQELKKAPSGATGGERSLPTGGQN